MYAPWKLRSAWASAQSDQSSLCALWVAKDQMLLHVNTEDSDQTGQMSMLIWVLTGRTCNFVGFVMVRLIYVLQAFNILKWCFNTTCLFKYSCAYRNDPKFSDTQNICCNHSKVWTMWLYHRLMSPNDADGMAISVDPLGAIWSGSALFAQAYLSENLGSLRYYLLWEIAETIFHNITFEPAVIEI